MTTYSHSRISTFEQCKYKYKLQYIDKIKADVPTTIELFMGNKVHQTLEKLYTDLKYEKVNTLTELLSFYNDLWVREWNNDILIVKTQYTEDNYRAMGEKYLTMYYNRHTPFNQLTILGIETQERMTLPDGNQYHVRIDKLACNGETYYVCDYKTNAGMKDQEEVDEDRQLAMYSIWVKDKFKDAKRVVLMWHMLAFDKDMTSERTDEQVRALLTDVTERIKEIETCDAWPTKVTNLCNYCGYKSMCPSFKHEVELEAKPTPEFKDDDGVKLVDEYATISVQLKTLEERKEDLKEQLVEFAKQKEIDMVYGSDKKASVKPYERIVYPEEKEEFIELLKRKGVYEEMSMVCYPKLNSTILHNNIDKEIIDSVSKETDYRVTLSKKK